MSSTFRLLAADRDAGNEDDHHTIQIVDEQSNTSAAIYGLARLPYRSLIGVQLLGTP